MQRIEQGLSPIRRAIAGVVNRIGDLTLSEHTLHERYPVTSKQVMEAADDLPDAISKDRAQRFYVETWRNELHPYRVRDLIQDSMSVARNLKENIRRLKRS